MILKDFVGSDVPARGTVGNFSAVVRISPLVGTTITFLRAMVAG
jgi:hypothetical protein